MMLALAPLLAAAVPAAAHAGLYRSSQPEIAAALELRPDGRFRYALDYGAVSEEGEGVWVADGSTVSLTSQPLPTAPSFAIVRDLPASTGELWVELENPGFDWGGPLEMLLSFDKIVGLVRVTASENGRVETNGGRVTAIRPVVPVYGTIGAPLALAGERGHRLTIRFLRNDLGKARFVSEPLAVTPGGLLLNRYETSIRLDRVGPPSASGE
jgi:hypothetical protein